MANKLMSVICSSVTAIQLISVQPINLTSILILFEENAGLQRRPIIRYMWRASFAVASIFLTIFFREQMAYVMGFDGALFDSLFTLLIPTTGILWLHWNRLRIIAKIPLVLALVLAGAYCVVGTYWAAQEIASCVPGPSYSQ